MNQGKRTSKRTAKTNAWHPTPLRVDAQPVPVGATGQEIFQTWEQDTDMGCYVWRESWPRGSDGKKGSFANKLPAAQAYSQNEWWGMGVGAEARGAALQAATDAVEAQAVDAGSADTPEQQAQMAAASAAARGLSIHVAMRLSAQATKSPMDRAARTRRLFSLRVFRLPQLLNSCIQLKIELQSISDQVLNSGNALLRTLFGDAAETLNKSEVLAFSFGELELDNSAIDYFKHTGGTLSGDLRQLSEVTDLLKMKRRFEDDFDKTSEVQVGMDFDLVNDVVVRTFNEENIFLALSEADQITANRVAVLFTEGPFVLAADKSEWLEQSWLGELDSMLRSVFTAAQLKQFASAEVKWTPPGADDEVTVKASETAVGVLSMTYEHLKKLADVLVMKIPKNAKRRAEQAQKAAAAGSTSKAALAGGARRRASANFVMNSEEEARLKEKKQQSVKPKRRKRRALSKDVEIATLHAKVGRLEMQLGRGKVTIFEGLKRLLNGEVGSAVPVAAWRQLAPNCVEALGESWEQDPYKLFEQFIDDAFEEPVVPVVPDEEPAVPDDAIDGDDEEEGEEEEAEAEEEEEAEDEEVEGAEEAEEADGLAGMGDDEEEGQEEGDAESHRKRPANSEDVQSEQPRKKRRVQESDDDDELGAEMEAGAYRNGPPTPSVGSDTDIGGAEPESFFANNPGNSLQPAASLSSADSQTTHADGDAGIGGPSRHGMGEARDAD